MKVEVDHLQNLHGHTEVGHGVGEAQVHSWLVAEAGFFFFFGMF